MQRIKFRELNQLTVGCWKAVVSVVPALFLIACTADPSEPPPDDGVTLGRSEIKTNGNEIEKAGCTHIRFCDQPKSANEVVCDTNDTPCSPGARLNECVSDADAVCGTDWGVMTLDPSVFVPGLGTVTTIFNG